MSAPTTDKKELIRRFRELEGELAQVQAQIASLPAGEPIPGIYLTMEVAGQIVALPSTQVREVVRMVEVSPLPGAPKHVLGSFVYRGEPVVAVDLAVFLGRASEARVESHLVILQASQALALVVDHVVSLVDAPQVAAQSDDPALQSWYASRLISGLCRSGDQLLPLLNLEPLLEGVQLQ
jgi:purine-binding chemotaxis protein CheW